MPYIYVFQTSNACFVITRNNNNIINICRTKCHKMSLKQNEWSLSIFFLSLTSFLSAWTSFQNTRLCSIGCNIICVDKITDWNLISKSYTVYDTKILHFRIVLNINCSVRGYLFLLTSKCMGNNSVECVNYSSRKVPMCLDVFVIAVVKFALTLQCNKNKNKNEITLQTAYHFIRYWIRASYFCILFGWNSRYV